MKYRVLGGAFRGMDGTGLEDGFCRDEIGRRTRLPGPPGVGREGVRTGSRGGVLVCWSIGASFLCEIIEGSM